jgi:type IV pilus assembly protein PilC
MLFHYLAVDQAGKTVEEDFEAATIAEVLRYLSGRELRPLSVKPLKAKGLATAVKFWGGITTTDQVFLTKYLALMLRVGTDLLSAINILIADFEKPAMRDFLLEVRDNLSRGQPFYAAFAKHPEIFSPIFVNLVRAAEASGNLQKTFDDLSVSLERQAELKSKIRSALVYPIIVLSLALAVLTFLVTFALPKLANVFANSGVHPPVFSQIVFTVGLFVGNNIVLLYALFFAFIAAFVFSIYKTETGKRAWNRIIMSLPVVRKIYSDLAVQRMASTISPLLRAGLPIVDAITTAADTVGHRGFSAALRRVANEGLAKGLTIGEAFKREDVFPKSVVSLIAISERAGHLDEVLATLADFYEASIDSSIKALVSLLEPLLLLAMGIIVVVIALSIIVPIYQLTSSF